MADVLEVVILGRKITLKTEGREEYVREIVKFVNEKIAEIRSAAPGLADTNVAVLASLHIADEYFEILDKQREMYQQIDRRCDDLLEIIDSKI